MKTPTSTCLYRNLYVQHLKYICVYININTYIYIKLNVRAQFPDCSQIFIHFSSHVLVFRLNSHFVYNFIVLRLEVCVPGMTSNWQNNSIKYPYKPEPTTIPNQCLTNEKRGNSWTEPIQLASPNKFTKKEKWLNILHPRRNNSMYATRSSFCAPFFIYYSKIVYHED